jgi:hypothetical protein
MTKLYTKRHCLSPVPTVIALFTRNHAIIMSEPTPDGYLFFLKGTKLCSVIVELPR